MNIGVENVDVNGGHCYMNSPTGYESKNHNYIDSTNKRDETAPNRSELNKDYRMMLTLVLCYLHPHLINMLIWNTIINTINFWAMIKFQYKISHQFQHWLQLLLHQQMTKDSNYLVQYTRRSSIQICLKLNQDILGVQVMWLSHRSNYWITKHEMLSYLNFLKDKDTK